MRRTHHGILIREKSLFRYKGICSISIRWLLIFLMYIPFSLNAQEQIDFEKIVEEVFVLQDEDIAYEELYEYLYQLYAHPLNLNAATQEDLISIYLLNNRQINNLIKYREQYGQLLSIFELRYIPGFDELTISRLLPFVEVKETAMRSDLSLLQKIDRAEKLFLLRSESTLEAKRGYLLSDSTSDLPQTSYYTGSPVKFYTRMRVSSRNDFSFGITLEKDAGEKISWKPKNNQYGLDFWSAHALLENQGHWKKVVVGDYNLQFGQGLLLGSGFSMGKGAETTMSLRPKNIGIQPYTSSMESGFFRGVGGTYSINLKKSRIDITSFYSNLNQDGRLQQDSLRNMYYFNSLGTSGYHRTQQELSARKKVWEQTSGSHILYNHANNNLHVGLIYLHTSYEGDYRKSPQPYNLYEFSSKQNNNLGAHADFHWGNISFFGEAATSQSGGTGAIGGLTAYLSSSIQMAWLVRNYDRDFHSFYGNAFGENTRNINESGMYWGIKLSPLQKLVISAYYDSFKFPWLRYGAQAPSDGYEYLIRADYALTRKTNFFVQFREESKAADVDDLMQKVLPGIKRNFAFNVRHEVNNIIRLRTRIQKSQYRLDGKNTGGFAVAQDVTLDFGRLKADGRYAIFLTEDYQNRQYLYENDVLYAFSVPVYSGVGVRSYLILRYKINKHLQCWVRAARTQYEDRDQVGSGLETIERNTRTDVRFQLVVKL